jgi:hypothetical protein
MLVRLCGTGQVCIWRRLEIQEMMVERVNIMSEILRRRPQKAKNSEVMAHDINVAKSIQVSTKLNAQLQ